MKNSEYTDIFNRIKTKEGNFLINYDSKYYFYVDKDDVKLKRVDVKEWDWAINTWDNSVSEFIEINDHIKNIIESLIKEDIAYSLMLSEGINLEVKPIGYDELHGLFEDITDFVHENFSLLYRGAVRLERHIEADYYAPRRIQINGTRLHESIGLKYADGHKYEWLESPSEKNIINACKDIQTLIDEAAKTIKTNLKLTITNH